MHVYIIVAYTGNFYGVLIFVVDLAVTEFFAYGDMASP